MAFFTTFVTEKGLSKEMEEFINDNMFDIH